MTRIRVELIGKDKISPVMDKVKAVLRRCAEALGATFHHFEADAAPHDIVVHPWNQDLHVNSLTPRPSVGIVSQLEEALNTWRKRAMAAEEVITDLKGKLDRMDKVIVKYKCVDKTKLTTILHSLPLETLQAVHNWATAAVLQAADSARVTFDENKELKYQIQKGVLAYDELRGANRILRKALSANGTQLKNPRPAPTPAPPSPRVFGDTTGCFAHPYTDTVVAELQQEIKRQKLLNDGLLRDLDKQKVIADNLSADRHYLKMELDSLRSLSKTVPVENAAVNFSAPSYPGYNATPRIPTNPVGVQVSMPAGMDPKQKK